MDLKEIMNQAKEDLQFDPTELDIASLNIPQLHNKYLNYLRSETVVFKKHRADYRRLYRAKWEYYTGKISEEELKFRGWEPFQLTILKQDLSIYLDADEDLIKLRSKMDYCEEKMKHLEEIIKNVNNLQWNIKNAIEWKKFVSGQ
tara:strand:- start:8703 stop:9137 length:435 start_codon:yes stop_codon:yes gene_type:complete